VTRESVAINVGRGGTDAAGRPVRPQGPTGTSPSSRPMARLTPQPSPRSSKTGLPAAPTPSSIWKPQLQETAYPRNHHAPDAVGHPVSQAAHRPPYRHRHRHRRDADRRPGRPRPTPSQRLRPHAQNRAAKLSRTAQAIALASRSRRMTSRQEPVTEPTGCEATKP
jgi:hypothetical protein